MSLPEKDLAELESLRTDMKSTDHQKILKLISRLCHKSVEDSNISEANFLLCIKPLIHQFMVVTEDPGLKTGILKCLLNVPESRKPIVIKEISCYLNNYLQNTDAVENISSTLQIIVVLINNSSTEDSILNINFHEITKFYENSIRNLSSKIQSKCSKVSEIKIVNTLHILIQTLILFVNKCFKQKKSVCFPHSIYDSVQKLIVCRKLSVTTIYNCGLLMVTLDFAFFDISSSYKMLESSSETSALECLAISYGFLACESIDFHCIRSGCSIPILILDTIWSIYMKYMNDSLVVVGVLKIVLLYSKKVTLSKYNMSSSSIEILLNLILMHLDHYLNTAKSLSKEALNCLILQKNNVVVSKLLLFLETVQRIDRKTCIILISLIKIESFSRIIASYPEVIDDLLKATENANSLSYVCQAYMSLMQSTYHDSFADEWFDKWIKPLLLRSDRYSMLLDHVLITAVKQSSIVHKKILIFCRDINDSNFEVIVNCIVEVKLSDFSNISDTLEILQLNSDQYWKGFIPIKIMKQAVCVPGSVTALKTASLIIEGNKRIDEFIPEEIELLKLFIDSQMTVHKSDIQQKFFNLIKKLLARLLTSYPQRNEYTEIHNHFVRWLVTRCMGSLFPGASYERRYIALRILECLINVGLWSVMNFEYEEISIFFTCLTDSFEENRQIAKNVLLLACLQENAHFEDSRMILHHRSIEMIEGMRFTEHNTAAYLLEILCSIPAPATFFTRIFEENLIYFSENEKEFREKESHFIYLTLLLSSLKSRLNALKGSSLVKFPLHGFLHAIRHLLLSSQISGNTNDSNWIVLINNIVRASISCNIFASKIVSQSSPEGYLPEEELSDSNNQHNFSAAQQLLLCSWRSVKEASLLLGDFVEKFAIIEDNSADYSNEKLFFDIGDHLKSLIYQIKHKGSFKQVYIALCQYCKRCWRMSDEKINIIPKKWLNEIQNDIMLNGDQLWLLRRGAGIPCIVLAILSTEFDEKHKYKSNVLNNFMEKIFEMLNNESCAIETKIHASNILCDLFKHKDLAEEMNNYVEKAIVVAINGVKSSNWNEKNTSNLLLSAILIRVFGVPRSRTEIAWKNKMTGKMFFQKYPSLFDVFLTHLNLCETPDAGIQSALYLILLIFARLYPSYDDEWNTTFQLNLFIPYIYQCSQSSIYKIRQLTVNAIIPFVTRDIYVGHIEKIWSHLMLPLPENTLHGLLMQFDGLLQNIPQLDSNSDDRLILVFTHVLLEGNRILNGFHSYVVKEKFILVLSSILRQYYQFIDITKMKNYPLDDRISISEGNNLNKQNYISAVQAFNIGIRYCYLKDVETNNFVNLIEKMFAQNKSRDVSNISLEFIRKIMANEEFQINNTILRNLTHDCDKNKILKEKILKSKPLYLGLIDNLKGDDKSIFYDVLYLLHIYIKFDQFDDSISETLLNFIERYCCNGEWINAFLLCLDVLLQKSNHHNEKYLRMLKILFQNIGKSSSAFKTFVFKHCGDSIMLTDNDLFLNCWTMVFEKVLNIEEIEMTHFKHLLDDLRYEDDYLLRKLFQCFCDKLKNQPLICAVGLLSCIIQDIGVFLDYDNGNYVFFNDLPEQFEEHLRVCQLAEKSLKDLIERYPSLLAEHLPGNLMNWIFKKASFHMEKLEEFSNLRDIVKFFYHKLELFFNKAEKTLFPNQDAIEKQIATKKLMLLYAYL